MLELLPGEIARVRVGNQRDPLLARYLPGGGAPVRGLAGPALAIDERAGIPRVVQRAQHPPVRHLVPRQLALAFSLADPAGEPQPVMVERVDDRARGSGPRERREQVTQRVLDGAVGVEHDLPGRVLDEPDRERHRQLSASGFGQDPALQPGTDEVQLGLAHRALQAEQQPVVEVCRVIETVLVADQRAGERGDLQQAVPVGVVARQPGDLESEHDPGLPKPDVGDEPLEPLAIGGAGAGLSLVGVDHDDLLDRPAELDRALAQRVLALRGLGVGVHLAQRRLTHIQVRRPRQMRGGHLRSDRGGAHRSPPGYARQRHARERADKLVADRDRFGLRRSSRHGRGGGPGAGPGHDAAALEHRKPEPPSGRVSVERAGAQQLIALNVLGAAGFLIGLPRFRRARLERARAPRTGDAPAHRTAQ